MPKESIDAIIAQSAEGEFLNLVELTKAAPDIMPEANYWSFSLFQSILCELASLVKPLPSSAGIAWNMLDGAWQFMGGVMQLKQVHDEETHRPYATTVKGTCNIMSAMQMMILTGVSFSVFGGPTFAAAFGVGFLLSLDDTYCAIRCYADRKYLEEDIKKKIIINDKIINNLNNEILVLKEKLSTNGYNWVNYQLLKSKYFRLTKLQEEQRELCDEQAIFSQDKNFIPISKLYSAAKNNEDAEKILHNKLRSNITKAVSSNIQWALAFAGMLLLCIPGAQPIGGMLIIAAATLYFLTHSYKLTTKANEYRLFRKEKKFHQERIETPDLSVSSKLV